MRVLLLLLLCDRFLLNSWHR